LNELGAGVAANQAGRAGDKNGSGPPDCDGLGLLGYSGCRRASEIKFKGVPMTQVFGRVPPRCVPRTTIL
jgi:hypothetical protein